MFNKNNKRLLQSPERSTEHLKSPRVVIMSKQKTHLDAIPENNPNIAADTQMMALEPREQLLLQCFAKLVGHELDERFSTFSETELKPLKKDVTEVKGSISNMQLEITALKEEKVELSQKLDSFNVKLSQLDKESRESNLIFYNLPKSSNVRQDIIELCTNVIRPICAVAIRKTLVLRQNQANQTMTVLVRFDAASTVDHILRNSKNLKSTRISVCRDLSEEDRENRKILLSLKNKIKENDTSDKLKIKVINNYIFIDNVKLTLNIKNNYFGNREVNGKQFVKEKFSIDFDNFVNNQQ